METLESRVRPEVPEMIERKHGGNIVKRTARIMKEYIKDAASDTVAFTMSSGPVFAVYELLLGREPIEVVGSRWYSIVYVYPILGPLVAWARKIAYKLFDVPTEDSPRKGLADITAVTSVAAPIYGAVLYLSGDDTTTEIVTTSIVGIAVGASIAKMVSHVQDEVREYFGREPKMKDRGSFWDTNPILQVTKYNLECLKIHPWAEKVKNLFKGKPEYSLELA